MALVWTLAPPKVCINAFRTVNVVIYTYSHTEAECLWGSPNTFSKLHIVLRLVRDTVGDFKNDDWIICTCIFFFLQLPFHCGRQMTRTITILSLTKLKALYLRERFLTAISGANNIAFACMSTKVALLESTAMLDTYFVIAFTHF